MDVKKQFGKNLRHYRKVRGLSQEQLAERAGVSAKHIGALETGASFVSAELLEKFAAELSTPVQSFFSEDGAEILPQGKELAAALTCIDAIVAKHITAATTAIISESKRAVQRALDDGMGNAPQEQGQ